MRPAIIYLILNINTTYTTLFIGGLVTFYTVYGGTKAVYILNYCK